MITTAPPKNSTVVQQMAEIIDSFEDKVLKQFAELHAKLSEQASAMETLRAKVDLSMTSLAQVQQDQAQLAKVIADRPPPPPVPRPPPLQLPPRDSAGLMGARPPGTYGSSSSTSNPFVTFPAPTPHPPHAPQVVSVPPSPRDTAMGSGDVELSNGNARKPWLPKLDFPRFDGSDVRIWIDKCQIFFNLYQIPAGFRVQAASMHMSDGADIGTNRLKC